jgi:hypothetical protein
MSIKSDPFERHSIHKMEGKLSTSCGKQSCITFEDIREIFVPTPHVLVNPTVFTGSVSNPNSLSTAMSESVIIPIGSRKTLESKCQNCNLKRAMRCSKSMCKKHCTDLSCPDHKEKKRKFVV